MKYEQPKIRILAIALVVLLASNFIFSDESPIDSVEGATPGDGWTIVMWMAGDNNLGGSGTTTTATQVDEDIQEIVDSGCDQDIVVVADEYGPDNTIAYHITNGIKTVIPITGVSGEANMGDPETYYNTINKVKSTYPNEKYAFIFWDHGMGWGGFCEEWVSPIDSMTNLELRLVMEYGYNELGEIDVVGFDACYMAQLDIIYECKDYASVFIASADLEPWQGWYYEFLSRVDEDTTPEEFGQFVCWDMNYYYTYRLNQLAWDGETRVPRNHTITAINLTLLDLDLLENFNQLFQTLKYNALTERTNIINAYYSSTRYLRTGSHDFFDLKDFADNMESLSSNTTIDYYADLLSASVTNCIIEFNSSSSTFDSYVSPWGNGIGFYGATGISGSSTSSGYWFGYNNLYICRFTQFNEYQSQFFSRADKSPNVPPELTITSSGATVTLDGSGVQYKLGKGPWLSESQTVSMVDQELYYRSWNGRDYSTQGYIVVTGGEIIVQGGFVTTSYILNAGWNVFAPFAHEPDILSASSLCQRIALDNTKVVSRQTDGTYLTYVQGSSREDYTLTRGESYYVYVSEYTELAFDGNTSASQDISLLSGWNFIGITANTNLRASDFSDDSITKLVKRSPGTEENYETYFLMDRRGDNFNLEMGEGVYIYTLEDTVVLI